MPSVAAISKGEFFQLFQRCMPPGGWPGAIAVANSGGPDSTCLLWHLTSLVKDGRRGLPKRVVSFHINHKLQEASDDMAELAGRTARALNIKHRAFTVPWSTPPYPEFPGPTTTELYARRARLRAFFDQMTDEKAAALALGHHADDQVETVIIRFGSGSGLSGLAGMRPVRRWGMGNSDNGELLTFGDAGMSRWMVRPFLSVPKDRILSTCERHGLRYAVDKTNFQPDLTPRNAIRHALDSLSPQEPSTSLDLDKFSAEHAKSSDVPKTRERFRETVQSLVQRIDMVSGQVDNVLARCLLPTLPSTVLLPSPWLRSLPGDTLEILMARVMRYVSCHPWGSPRSQATGSRTTYQKIFDKIIENERNAHHRMPFTPGASILFKPGSVTPSGRFLQVDGHPDARYSAWRLQRAPPYTKKTQVGEKESDRLVLDITSLFKQWRSQGRIFTLLYDNRFLLSFDLGRVPRSILMSLTDGKDARIYVTPYGQEHSPRLVLRTGLGERTLADYQRDVLGLSGRTAKFSVPLQRWVRMKLVRTMQTI